MQSNFLASLGALVALVAANTASLGAQDRAKLPTVAVVQFTNSSLVNAADYAPLSKGMADLLGSTLRTNPTIRVVDRDALQEVLREQDLAKDGRVDPATAAVIGRLTGAQYLVKGTFFIEPKGRVRITAQAVNSTTGEVAHSESANGTTEDLLAVIDQLGARLSSGMKLGEVTPPKRGNDGAGPGRWANVMKYSRALDADDKGDKRTAMALYTEFLSDPVTAVYTVDQREHAEKRVRTLSGS